MALTNEVSGSSIINMVNPFSSFVGGKTWAPQSVINEGHDPIAREAIWKTVTGLVGAGALTAAIRLYMGAMETKKNFTKKPIKTYLDTTSESPIDAGDIDYVASQVNKKKPISKKAAVEWSDFVQYALPAAGVVGGSVLGYNLVDRIMEKHDAREYDKQIAYKSDLLKKLVAARALNARGQLTDQNYNKVMQEYDAYTKTASLNKYAEGQSLKDRAKSWLGLDKTDETGRNWFDRPISKGVGALGLILTIAMAASAYASKEYFDKNDPARIKEKAMKEGLEAYSKERMYDKPLFAMNPSKKLFQKLDAQPGAPAPVIPQDTTSQNIVPQAPVSIPL